MELVTLLFGQKLGICNCSIHPFAVPGQKDPMKLYCSLGLALSFSYVAYVEGEEGFLLRGFEPSGITLGKGGQIARAASAVLKLIAKEGKSSTLNLPSGMVCLISKNCSATIRQVVNVRANSKSMGRVDLNIG